MHVCSLPRTTCSLHCELPTKHVQCEQHSKPSCLHHPATILPGLNLLHEWVFSHWKPSTKSVCHRFDSQMSKVPKTGEHTSKMSSASPQAAYNHQIDACNATHSITLYCHLAERLALRHVREAAVVVLYVYRTWSIKNPSDLNKHMLPLILSF